MIAPLITNKPAERRNEKEYRITQPVRVPSVLRSCFSALLCCLSSVPNWSLPTSRGGSVSPPYYMIVSQACWTPIWPLPAFPVFCPLPLVRHGMICLSDLHSDRPPWHFNSPSWLFFLPNLIPVWLSGHLVAWLCGGMLGWGGCWHIASRAARRQRNKEVVELLFPKVMEYNRQELHENQLEVQSES